MAKKYIFANSSYSIYNPPQGVTVLQFDTETNSLGIYDNKKPVASVMVQAETDNDNKFEKVIIPSKLSDLQNDTNFITKADIPVLDTGISEEFLVTALNSYTKNYTAFQVMPNKIEIASGTVDDVTGLTYNYPVSACTIHKMTLRSSQEPENCDVIIDWGDGCIESIKDRKFNSHTEGKSYELFHDYSSSMTKNIQRFIIKIYGKDYYTFRHNSYRDNNLISRLFDKDLPIASHVTNFASVGIYANRLLAVHIPHSSNYITNAYNLASVFSNCKNLIKVTGFEDNPLRTNCIINNIFSGDKFLQTTDFKLTACPNDNTYGNCFNACQNLDMDINDLIPTQGFNCYNARMHYTFRNTKKLKGTIPNNLFWNSHKFSSFTQAFSGSALADQAPKSWGGKADNTIINKTIEQRLIELEKAIL